jgi:hypothetical protein
MTKAQLENLLYVLEEAIRNAEVVYGEFRTKKEPPLDLSYINQAIADVQAELAKLQESEHDI